MNLAVVVVAILVGLTMARHRAAAQRSASMTTSPPHLDRPLRWRGTESFVHTTLGVRDTEIARRITPGAAGARRFEASLRTFGATGLNNGISGTARNRLNIDHPSLADQDPLLTVIQARVTPIAAVAENCADNAAETRARATVFGVFFNAVTVTHVRGRHCDIIVGSTGARTAR